MSTEAVGSAPTRPGRRWLTDLRTARVLRFGFGVTAAMAIAFGVEWPLFFLTPVFTAVFLSLPLPAPSLGQCVRSIGYVVIAFFLGLTFTLYLMPFPAVYIILLGLVMFHIYYLANRGGPFWLVLMSLVSVIILPMLGNTHDAVPVVFALYFAWSSTLSVLISILAHGVFPDPESPAGLPKRPGFQSGYQRPAALAALKSTLATLPLIVLFIALNWTSQVLVAIFVAIFSLSPALASTRAAGLKSLISTLMGGAIALGLYQLLVAVPEFHFFVVLMLITFLLLGAAIFSDRPDAKYMGSAATTVVVLLGSVMGEGASIADKFLGRIVLIAAATLYMVAALHVLERFLFRQPAQIKPQG